jgi:hypothetical protein
MGMQHCLESETSNRVFASCLQPRNMPYCERSPLWERGFSPPCEPTTPHAATKKLLVVAGFALCSIAGTLAHYRACGPTLLRAIARGLWARAQRSRWRTSQHISQQRPGISMATYPINLIRWHNSQVCCSILSDELVAKRAHQARIAFWGLQRRNELSDG